MSEEHCKIIVRVIYNSAKIQAINLKTRNNSGFTEMLSNQGKLEVYEDQIKLLETLLPELKNNKEK